jgi:hypothetical protein
MTQLDQLLQLDEDGDECVVCADCWALVMNEDRARHAAWHEKLRRAVDETEALA